jgi:hypothetical protein
MEVSATANKYSFRNAPRAASWTLCERVTQSHICFRARHKNPDSARIQASARQRLQRGEIREREVRWRGSRNSIVADRSREAQRARRSPAALKAHADGVPCAAK